MKLLERRLLALFTVLALSLSLTGGALAANVLENGINYQVFTTTLDVPEETTMLKIERCIKSTMAFTCHCAFIMGETTQTVIFEPSCVVHV